MRELIQRNLDYLSQLTKHEADFIEDILSWDNEQKVAFKMAKKIFEEDISEANSIDDQSQAE